MKPVIKKTRVYNIILMGDNGSVRNMRIRAFWFKAVAYVFLFLLLAAGGGVFGAYYYFERHQASLAERDELRAERDSYKAKAESTVISDVVGTGNKEDAKPSLVSEPIRSPGNGLPMGQNGPPPVSGGAASPPAPQDQGQNSGQTQAPVAQDPPPGFVDNPAVPDSANQHPARIIDPKIEFSGNRVRFHFDLTNLEPSKALNGNLKLSLVTPKGTVPVAGVPQGDLRFQLNRLKRMRINFNLPDGVTADDLTTIQVEIISDGNPILVETVPVVREAAPASEGSE